MALPLNRATRDIVGVSGQQDSAYSDYVATDVMVEQVSDGTNVRHVIWQISSGSAINPNSVSTYDAAPTGSIFYDNAGLAYRKTAASTWVSSEA